MCTVSCPATSPDRGPTGRFPRLDAGPLPGVLGHPSVLNAAPLLPLRGRARGSTLSARITSPLRGHVMRGLRPTLTARLDAWVWRLCNPLPGRFASGAGRCPRMTWPAWAPARAWTALTATGSPGRSGPVVDGSGERDSAAPAACPTAMRRPPTEACRCRLSRRDGHLKPFAI